MFEGVSLAPAGKIGTFCPPDAAMRFLVVKVPLLVVSSIDVPSVARVADFTSIPVRRGSSISWAYCSK